jgi:hypothetical protein
MRQWKIALSLAVVGALAAPFASGTHKARPWYYVRVPLTAQDKEWRANYFRSHGNHCPGIVFPEAILVPADDPDAEFCHEVRAELESGTRSEYRRDLPKYWMMNVGVAAATAASLFGLTFLIPMLIRGIAFLARRYWRWLSA